jgi:predicted helicase
VWIEKAFLASSVRRSVRTASDRGQLTMACGTGKTLVGLLVAEARTHAHACPRPSLSLLAQTLREWTAKRQARLRYLAVCSDETVVGEDAVVSRTCELPERGPNDAAR